MVSERRQHRGKSERKSVLILVLVEDGLGEDDFVGVEQGRYVLILVLVEDGLGVGCGGIMVESSRVLILVLVEDGRMYSCSLCSLNPCFSGGWSRRMKNIMS